jgi:competence protein ComEA
MAVFLLLTSKGSDEPSTAAVPSLVVELNTAPPEVLSALPRLGPARANAILEARERAPFRSFEDFDRRVRGIGPATVAAIKPYARIAAPEEMTNRSEHPAQ